ncbi:hypothetical protein K1719_040864 [Acacia pycnantha]|nr:hypothetical protein K1719_040864 [Acacia pycnantha]
MGALVTRRQNQKKRLHVEFDADMNTIGKEEDSFISYLGYLARSKVPIVYSSWKLVPQKTKELIWSQILQTYDVPNNKAMNKHWMGELERRLMEEELEKMKEDAKSDPSITVQAPEPPPRHKKWKAARIKDGKYINSDVL